MTLAYGLADSPAGLLAWLVEKDRACSDCGGDLASRFTDDFLLTQASLYWFTSSMPRPSGLPTSTSTAAPLRSRGDRPDRPRCFPGRPQPAAEEMGGADPQHHALHGDATRGHFAAHEEPGLLAADITDFFCGLRPDRARLDDNDGNSGSVD